jgi:dolichol-phosphate mannosyltransferase
MRAPVRDNMSGSIERVVIVTPTYNERDNVGPLLDRILRQQSRVDGAVFSVVVVDDSSPDGTGQAVAGYARSNDGVHLLNGEPKRGIGRAYQRGFAYAIEVLRADTVFQMDADLSHDADDIPRMIAAIRGGADFVIGSRYVAGGDLPQSWSAFRKANSRWGNIFARHIAGLRPLRDCTSGFRAIRADLLRRIAIQRLASSGYAFLMTLLYEAVRHGARVVEVPIRFGDRAYGRSKLGLRDVVEFIALSLRLRISMMFGRRRAG